MAFEIIKLTYLLTNFAVINFVASVVDVISRAVQSGMLLLDHYDLLWITNSFVSAGLYQLLICGNRVMMAPLARSARYLDFLIKLILPIIIM